MKYMSPSAPGVITSEKETFRDLSRSASEVFLHTIKNTGTLEKAKFEEIKK
jgi:hypothetical protein